MLGLPDIYTIKARLLPALIAAMPGLVLAAVMVSWQQLGLSHARELDAARDQLAVARARVAELEARADPARAERPQDGKADTGRTAT